jgi:hypothetical protein
MDGKLIEVARQRIAEKALPAAPPKVILGDYSEGTDCSLCRAAIAPRTPEIEVDCGGATYVFHPSCYSAWSSAIRGLF